MEKLFGVYLGGRAPRCHIELHDVVFVVGKSIEDTYPSLKEKWFGDSERLHIDSYIELKYIDGFEIELTKQKPKDEENKLYFVNFGAYTEHLFGEVHQCAFYVNKTKSDATKKALESLCVGMVQPHCDDHLLVDELLEPKLGQFDLDDLIEIDTVDGYFLNFIPHSEATTSQAIPGYRRFKNPN